MTFTAFKLIQTQHISIAFKTMREILWWIVAGYFQIINWSSDCLQLSLQMNILPPKCAITSKICPAWPTYAWTHCTDNTWDYLLIYFYSNFYFRSVWPAEIYWALYNDLDAIILPPDWSIFLVNLNRQIFILQTYLILQKGCLMLKKEYGSALKFVILDKS